MRVGDIINKVSLFLFSSDDICYVSSSLKVCEEFMNKFRNDGEYTEEKKKFLIKNQNSINAGNLLLKIIENYYGNIELLKSEIIEMKKDSGNKSHQLLLTAKESLLEQQKQELEDAKKLAIKLNINALISYYYFNHNTGLFDVDIVDSESCVYGKEIDPTRNLNRFEEIDESFKKESVDHELRY